MRNCCHRGLSVPHPISLPWRLLLRYCFRRRRERERFARLMVGDVEAEHNTKQRINAAKPPRVSAPTYPCVLWRGVCMQMRYGRGVSLSLCVQWRVCRLTARLGGGVVIAICNQSAGSLLPPRPRRRPLNCMPPPRPVEKYVFVDAVQILCGIFLLLHLHTLQPLAGRSENHGVTD
jgi:hypothetical protein